MDSTEGTGNILGGEKNPFLNLRYTLYLSCTWKKDRDQVALGRTLKEIIPAEAY
jgi:hypothetical protein